MATDSFLGQTRTIAASALHDSMRVITNGFNVLSGDIIETVRRSTTGAYIGTLPCTFLTGLTGGTVVQVAGRNTDVDSGTVPEVIAPSGVDGFHGVAGTDELNLNVTSANNDDSINGTGAQQVYVGGIEASTGMPVIARFSLNGSGTVTNDGSVAIKFARIQSAVTWPRANIAALTITSVTGGSTVGVIPAGAGAMPAAFVHVPVGYKGEVLAASGACETASGSATLEVVASDSTSQRTLTTFQVSHGNPFSTPPGEPLGVVGELGTVWLRASVSTDNNTLSGTLTVRLVKMAPPSNAERLKALVDQMNTLSQQLNR